VPWRRYLIDNAHPQERINWPSGIDDPPEYQERHVERDCWRNVGGPDMLSWPGETIRYKGAPKFGSAYQGIGGGSSTV